MNKCKVTLSMCSQDVLIQYPDGYDYEYPADSNDIKNLKPGETKEVTYHKSQNVLHIFYN